MADENVTDERERPKARERGLKVPEVILLLTAALVTIGWIARWRMDGGAVFGSYFLTLSFYPALLIVVALCLKYFGKLPLRPRLERLALAILTPLPFFGFICELISQNLERVDKFLTVVGSLVLAYVAATTYWRERVPRALLDPFGLARKKAEKETATSGKEETTAATESAATQSAPEPTEGPSPAPTPPPE